MFTFSVITANYNSGRKLAETAACVRQQGPLAEHVIVDGVSTDESLAIAQDLARTEGDRIQFRSEPDRGVYDAMNKGLRLARGRYIIFLGAGDTLRPQILTQIAALLPAHDRGFVYGDVQRGGGYGRYAGRFDWKQLYYLNICQQAIFYGREVFQICGEFDLRYRAHADWELNMRCFGARRIEKRYVDALIADFEEGGISAQGDPVFERDKLRMVRKDMGLYQYSVIKLWHLKARLRKLAGQAARAVALR